MRFWMSPVLWHCTLRTMQRETSATLLTLASVVIGVAGAVAIHGDDPGDPSGLPRHV